MIKTSRNQDGSALVVTVIILVIALIGALGFVIWNNVTSKEAVNTQETSNTTNKVDVYEGWNTYESNENRYSIKYPKDWIALKETVQDGPYIRNFDPATKDSQDGYPEGYINLRETTQTSRR